MPPDGADYDMDHAESAESTFVAVPKASPQQPDMAWSVSDAMDIRIIALGCEVTKLVQGKSLTVHLGALSSLIRDVIKIYPGQNLVGDTLVFQEPYAALMHHMSDLEMCYMTMITKDKSPTAECTRLSYALATLLEYLRPIYQQSYVPAQQRLNREQPIVTFDDLWVLFKPNSLAYAKIDDHWIGCKIGPIAKWPADPKEELPARWDVGIWYLQTDLSTEEIGCATRVREIQDFDGDMSPTELPVIPCQFHDISDGGARKKAFEERGQKILDILWGSARQYRHSGKFLLSHQLHQGDVLVTGGGVYDEDEDEDDKHIWDPTWSQPWSIIPKEDPLFHALERKIDPKKDSRDVFTDDMHAMLSPCLSVLTLLGANLHLVHVDNIQSSRPPELLPEPILHHNQLRNLISLAERQGAEGLVLRERHGDTSSNSITVVLIGQHGVGKGYTANYISWKTGRPLITIRADEFDYPTDMKKYEPYLSHISKMHNAMILFRYTDDSRPRAMSNDSSLLNRLDTLVFISANSTSVLSSTMLPFSHMVISYSTLDYKRQKKLWLNMMDIHRSRPGTKYVIDFEKSATTFLSSADMPKVDWNGHDINKCLEVAILSAQTVSNPSPLQKEHNLITVEVEHLKEAMNMAFASRSAIDHISGRTRLPATHSMSGMPPHMRPGGARDVSMRAAQLGDDDSSDDLVLDFGGFHEYDELSDDEESSSIPAKEKRVKSDSNNARSRKLCIAELNEVEWSTFKTLGTTELFRSKRFYAIDVLIGEPQIWRELPSLLGKKHRNPMQGMAPRSMVTETNRQQNTATLAADAALPERIRVNSPAIIKAFLELRIDESTNLRGSFLLFRPYKVLSYYEKELREWTEKLEQAVKANREHPDGVDKDKGESRRADIAEMKCLLSFIDTYLKERGQIIKDSLVQSVIFDDLWFLFKPGNTVVRNDIPQAYRVVRVATTRHHIKKHKDTSLSFFKDSALVEFDQRCIFIQCVHIDFDGRLLGPVTELFPISYFIGEKPISSLPIYPIEFSIKPEMSRAFLIERGQAFAKAGSIGHMHYRGLTLPTKESSKLRDEVDSQVVVDFEEAFNRFPKWMPRVKKTVLEEEREADYDQGLPPHNPPPDRRPPGFQPNNQPVEWKPDFWHTQNRMHWACIPECCSRETIYHDDVIDERTRNDYMAYQANEHSTLPSAAIEARSLSDLNDTLKDDDFLIMSYRVFGFVLRSRKWHQLDLADASPAETNSDAFDQLVLPEGHKHIVTSMMTKHFRDRQSTSSNRVQTDIVRGKGRGLIMLLHGVPGVGKTSTAECLAVVFNRPLFQITSGDLGITAKDVDHNLEENFSLANRWNCILLIDEADVFLAQRSKEDFVQNSLVAVFLRIMEYYSGVLFLTTNRVGVFDEAFSSRIHISLYYPPLDRQQTLEIFKKNWERILARSKEDSRHIDIDQSEITQFAMDYFDNNKQGRWNGRQIRNAFQSALAMAEFELLDMDGVNDDDNAANKDREATPTVKLGKKHFEEVAKAYKGFVDYLNKVYGVGSARRARENMWRFDPDDESTPKRPNALSQRLKFTGEPIHQPSRNVDPGFATSQYSRGFGPGYENPSNYGPMIPPRGGYPGPHEYQYPPGAFVPRTHGMEQSPYSDHLRASGPSSNYQPAQPQTYGTRTNQTPQHEMQTSQSAWAGSSRDGQLGVYPYQPGEQSLGAATGPNIRWSGDTEAGGSQQDP